jgi:hypothetical protein
VQVCESSSLNSSNYLHLCLYLFTFVLSAHILSNNISKCKCTPLLPYKYICVCVCVCVRISLHACVCDKCGSILLVQMNKFVQDYVSVIPCVHVCEHTFEFKSVCGNVGINHSFIYVAFYYG